MRVAASRIDMKTLPLTKGYVAMVDDEDYERLTAFKWQAAVYSSPNYQWVYGIRTGSKKRGEPHTIMLHRFILGGSEKVDHRDGNGLNNQRCNLRAASDSQNSANSRRTPGGSSKYKGVYWDGRKLRWRAVVQKDKVQYRIGRFRDEVDAATAYNLKAYELFGEFAKMNVPLGENAPL